MSSTYIDSAHAAPLKSNHERPRQGHRDQNHQPSQHIKCISLKGAYAMYAMPNSRLAPDIIGSCLLVYLSRLFLGHQTMRNLHTLVLLYVLNDKLNLEKKLKRSKKAQTLKAMNLS